MTTDSHNQRAGLRTVEGKSVRNTILLHIPDTEVEALCPHLTFLPLELATCLQRELEAIKTVYFMNRGIASMLVETADGRSVEVGIAGREDMIGLPLAAGLHTFTHSVIAQGPDDGFRVDGATMQPALRSLPELSRLLIRQLGIRSAQLAQSSACKQRPARRLLAAHDRLDAETARPTVSIEVAELERDGIRRGRGSIRIVDRKKLEQQTCECYGTSQQFNAELGLTRTWSFVEKNDRRGQPSEGRLTLTAILIVAGCTRGRSL